MNGLFAVFARGSSYVLFEQTNKGVDVRDADFFRNFTALERGGLHQMHRLLDAVAVDIVAQIDVHALLEVGGDVCARELELFRKQGEVNILGVMRVDIV